MNYLSLGYELLSIHTTAFSNHPQPPATFTSEVEAVMFLLKFYLNPIFTGPFQLVSSSPRSVSCCHSKSPVPGCGAAETLLRHTAVAVVRGEPPGILAVVPLRKHRSRPLHYGEPQRPFLFFPVTVSLSDSDHLRLAGAQWHRNGSGCSSAELVRHLPA